MIIPPASFFTLAIFPESACANIPINDSSVVVPSVFPKLIVPLFLAVWVFPLFLANIPTDFFANILISPLGPTFSPVPVSETKIPTPSSADISISFLFFTSPSFWAKIPIDFLAVDIILILPLFTAVETSFLEFLPSANIPTPSSAFKLIPYSWPTPRGLVGIVVLFSIFEPSLASIPIDFTLFTLMIPLSLLIAVEFFLANIPIFSLLVAEFFKVITPVFSAFTLALSRTSFFESFINIIPTDDSLSTLIAFLLDNVNFEVAVVTELVTFPSIPTEFLFFISISPLSLSIALLSAISLVPVISLLFFVNSTNIPAESFPSIVIFFLFIALLFLAYIPADSSFFVVIEATRAVLSPVFSILASSPYIPAELSSSIRIVPLFTAEAFSVLTNIPTDFFFLVVIVPVKLFLSSCSLITTVVFVPSVVPNIPTDFSSSNKIIFLFVNLEFSPAIPIESVLEALILPSLTKVDSFFP